jgi:hypothetical protein
LLLHELKPKIPATSTGRITTKKIFLIFIVFYLLNIPFLKCS